jgi:CRP-like cAMP-binding protein
MLSLEQPDYPKTFMTDVNDLNRHFLRQIASFPELRAAGVHRTAKKGEEVFRPGDEQTMFAIEWGLVKLCFISGEGKEWIRSFAAAPGVFSQVYLQRPDEDTTFSAIALEDSSFIAYPYPLLVKIGAENPDLVKAGFEVIQSYLLQRERRARNMLSLSAEESYRDFLQEHADIATRLTQADISRYLGVTPVALSRIRQRMEG